MAMKTLERYKPELYQEVALLQTNGGRGA
jgi:hypothetical protein